MFISHVSPSLFISCQPCIIPALLTGRMLFIFLILLISCQTCISPALITGRLITACQLRLSSLYTSHASPFPPNWRQPCLSAVSPHRSSAIHLSRFPYYASAKHFSSFFPARQISHKFVKHLIRFPPTHTSIKAISVTNYFSWSACNHGVMSYHIMPNMNK